MSLFSSCLEFESSLLGCMVTHLGCGPNHRHKGRQRHAARRIVLYHITLT